MPQMLTQGKGLVSALDVGLSGQGFWPVLRSEPAGIADGKGAGAASRFFRKRPCRNISWFHYLPQSSPVSRISASQRPRGPLRALGSKTPRPWRCRGGGTHSSSPAHPLTTHWHLGLVVPGRPYFPRMPVAEDARTTKSNRLRSALCSDQVQGLVSIAEANLKLQLPGSIACPLFGRLRQGAEVPSVPRSCYYSFSVLTAFQKRAAPGLCVPEYSEGGGGVLSA